jgi:hypothetical protein
MKCDIILSYSTLEEQWRWESLQFARHGQRNTCFCCRKLKLNVRVSELVETHDEHTAAMLCHIEIDCVEFSLEELEASARE